MKHDSRRLLLLVSLVAACAVPPLAELDSAWRAYQTASTAGAAERAPEQFQAASSALVEGQDWIDQGDYDKAREALKRAHRLADAAAGPAASRAPEPSFTDQPSSEGGVTLSPLVGGSGTPSTPRVEPEAPPAEATAPAVPPPPAVEVPGSEAAPSPPAEAPPQPSSSVDSPPGAATPAPALAQGIPPERDLAEAIRAEREHLMREESASQSAPSPEAAPALEVPAIEGARQPEMDRSEKSFAAEPERGIRVVKKGETLYSIAREHYGDQRAWKRIYDANRLVLASPSDIRAGMRLILPAAGSEPVAGTLPKNVPTVDAASAVAAPATTYKVRSGENLHTIAQKMYGDDAYWKLIFDANRATLADPDAVKKGMKLILPPKPSH